MPIQLSNSIFLNAAGIYVHSQKNTTKGPFKIGLSINLKQRLASYHTCFPDGFYIRNVLILEKYYEKIPRGRSYAQQQAVYFKRQHTYYDHNKHGSQDLREPGTDQERHTVYT